MRKKMCLMIMAMTFVLFKSSFLCAQSKESGEPKIRVNLVISAEELIRGQIRNDIKKELAKFKDIIVVDSGEGDWKLDVIGVRRSTTGGGYQDYAFAVAILQPAKREQCTFEGHELITGSPSVLDGSRSVANLFLKKYLHKETKGIVNLYNH